MRRSQLAVLFAGCALSFGACAEELVLKFSHFLGAQSFFQRDVAEPWGKRLEAKTGGKARLEVFHGGSAYGDVRKQAGQAKDGTVDIALGLRGAEGDRFPASSVIELPFLVRDSEGGSRALWGLYRSGVLDSEYRDYKVLALFVHDPGLIHTTGKRVVNLAI